MVIWSGFIDYSQVYSASRGDGQFFCSHAVFNSQCFVESSYVYKTRQNATFTGQERQEDVQLKAC